ncbi:MAG: hypothetical protein ACOC1F_08020 [Myxococcota bacterium]
MNDGAGVRLLLAVQRAGDDLVVLPRVSGTSELHDETWLSRVIGEGAWTACYVSASYEYIQPVD